MFAGIQGGTGALDPQTLAALLAAGGGEIPAALQGMMGIQPGMLGLQAAGIPGTSGIPGLPAGISPAAMLQALQVRLKLCSIISVQGTVDLWSYILPINRY